MLAQADTAGGSGDSVADFCCLLTDLGTARVANREMNWKCTAIGGRVTGLKVAADILDESRG